MSVVLLGSTSGSVTLQEPAVAGSTVIDLPATSGTMAVTSGSPSFTNITATGTLTVNGNTTLGDASTDTILMTGAPSIGGAGLGMGMGFRNRIINGAMVIDQRNAGASVTPTNQQYTLDRWISVVGVASKFSVQQRSTNSSASNYEAGSAPAGFVNSLKVTSLSAYSLSAGDVFGQETRIEGVNTADLGWGTANAQTITVSFWVRSSLTGTFGGVIRNANNTRSYPFLYTISSANTWEYETITIPGDTSGTWPTGTADAGIKITLGLGVGSTYSGTAGSWASAEYYGATGATSVVGTNGATFYITGVQLEKGSTATSFDYRPYGTELALCQRYYYRISAAGANFTEYGTGYINTTSTAQVLTIFPVTMRTAPSAVDQSGTAANYGVLNLNVSTTSTSVPTFSYASVAAARTVFTTAATLVAGQGCMGRSESTAAYLGWSAEL